MSRTLRNLRQDDDNEPLCLASVFPFVFAHTRRASSRQEGENNGRAGKLPLITPCSSSHSFGKFPGSIQKKLECFKISDDFT